MPKLKHSEIATIEEAFDIGQGAGFVLDFSDKTFSIFFEDEFKIDIDDNRYKEIGNSKGKRFRSFIGQENSMLVARVLRCLWDYRAAIIERQGKIDSPTLMDSYFQIIHKLEGQSEIAKTDALDKFENNQTLDELITAIQRDIQVNKPQAALDRLHTYCMKKFAHLLSLRGYECTNEDPLDSRVGKYIKFLETEFDIHQMSLRIMKGSISVFESFNNVRNNNTFAHDNEILGLHEARFIFDSVSNVLRFIRSFEAGRFGG